MKGGHLYSLSRIGGSDNCSAGEGEPPSTISGKELAGCIGPPSALTWDRPLSRFCAINWRICSAEYGPYVLPSPPMKL